MGERMRVVEPMRLLAFLRGALPGWKRTTLEQRIRAGCVRVNGATLAKNDFVAVGDEVEVVDRASADLRPPPPAGITVLHEDEALIAIAKPAGLLSVSSDDERARTALALVRSWLSQPRAPARLWPVHRLDRETSGVLLLAKTSDARRTLQANWSAARKTYLAIVEGRPKGSAGTIDEPLWEDEQLFVRVGEGPEAKAARTRWRVLESAGTRSLLEVELDTGRRHQIRAHLAWLGHPVVGDDRYGAKGPRMLLHALRLEVPHPVEGRTLVLEAPAPRELRLR
ncbi:MAG: RluA family pseudouridine synthase [Planctomycetes bacterium]|nr:RluA family pseudouridine synthase [Planctomycetota bacterium]